MTYTAPTPPADAPEIVLDVRPLLADGTEPFPTIMDAVDTLPTGATLVLRAPFDPEPLHTVMQQRGFAHATVSRAPGDVVTRYWRQG